MDPTTHQEPFLARLASILRSRGEQEDAAPVALHEVMARFACDVGTLHGVDPATGRLTLRHAVGVPDHVLYRVRDVPIGKGMAGLAAERREPVQVCNLQTDASGVAKPMAKDTGSQASIAVPMLVRGELRGVLGVGRRSTQELDEEEKRLLLEAGRLIGEAWGGRLRT